MKKQIRTAATITATEYKSTSFYGNPSRWVWFTDDAGRFVIQVKTVSGVHPRGNFTTAHRRPNKA